MKRCVRIHKIYQCFLEEVCDNVCNLSTHREYFFEILFFVSIENESKKKSTIPPEIDVGSENDATISDSFDEIFRTIDIETNNLNTSDTMKGSFFNLLSEIVEIVCCRLHLMDVCI